MKNYIFYAPEWIGLFIVLLVIGILTKSRKVIVFAFILLAGLLTFYRDGAPSSDYLSRLSSDLVISPADGKVLEVVRHKTHLQISIFLNVNNVHVQYSPMKGRIVNVQHYNGTFVPAYLFEKSALNERTETTLETQIGKVSVVQIAGLIARRIVSFKKPDDPIERGEPLGLIKFGSRCDIWLPLNRVQPLIKKGQRVRIGQPIARIVV
jgi:phosphatidylserine decarboxylase